MTALGAWLLRQKGWHLARSLWYLFFPTLLAVEVLSLIADRHRADLSALLVAAATVLLVPPAFAVILARYMRRGWLERGWAQPGNDGQAADHTTGHARG
jgi:hypothetical protein